MYSGTSFLYNPSFVSTYSVVIHILLIMFCFVGIFSSNIKLGSQGTIKEKASGILIGALIGVVPLYVFLAWGVSPGNIIDELNMYLYFTSGAIIEEIAFRYAFPRLLYSEGYPPLRAHLISNITFSMLHWFVWSMSPSALILGGAFGIANSLLIQFTGSFSMAIWSHTLHNIWLAGGSGILMLYLTLIVLVFMALRSVLSKKMKLKLGKLLSLNPYVRAFKFFGRNWKFIVGSVLALIVIIYIFLATAPRGMNLNFMVVDLGIYDSEGNFIQGANDQQFYLFSSGVQIGGVGIVAEVEINEKLPGTVDSLIADLWLDVDRVQWEHYGVSYDMALPNPLIWTGNSMDWTSHLNQRWNYDSGLLFTDGDLEREITATVGASLYGGVGYPSMEGVTFNLDVRITLVVHSSGVNGVYPDEIAEGTGVLSLTWSQYPGDTGGGGGSGGTGGISIYAFNLVSFQTFDISTPDLTDSAIIGGF